MNILLTSAGRRSYLVQYFKEALRAGGWGGLVHTANSGACPAFAGADKWVITPLIYDKEYIPFLLEYCKKEKIGLLVPLFDIDIPVLSAHRQEFGAIGTQVVTPEPETAAICNDKWKTHSALIEAKIRVPASWLDEKLAAQRVRAGAFSWPLIVKPRWGMGSLSVYQADSEDEMKVFSRKCRRGIAESYLKYESKANENASVLYQQRIGGMEFGLDVINDLDGNYCNTIVKQKLSMRSGETDGAVTVENEKLQGIGRRLGELLRHPGNLDVDVLEENGVYYVLEMNPRFGGGYPFSHVAGVNLPLAIIYWAMGKSAPKELLTAKAGVRAQKDIQILVWQPAG